MTSTVFDIFGQVPLQQRGPVERWAAASGAGSPLRAVVTAAWGAATVGEVFFAGYQGALEVALGGGRTKALLVTELGAASPRQMTTSIEGRRVTGAKAFAMLEVEEWWVLARRGDELVLARLDAVGEGADVTPTKTGFLRDVPHGAVRFDHAVADREIDDAWVKVVRPFRAVEDCAVLIAMATALLGAISDPAHQDELLGVIAGLAHLFGLADDLTYRALVAQRQRLLGVADAAELHGPLAEVWHEYQPLAGIAQSARRRRLDKARQRTLIDAW